MSFMVPPVLTPSNGGTASVQLNAGTTTSNVALPLDASGKPPVACYISTNGTVYVTLGQSGITATASGILMNINNPIILNTRNMTYLAGLSPSGNVLINITPLEIG
jgi:hypothetical protein